MRILFASTGGAGHFTPLVPWLEMSVRRGHEILVIGPARLAETTARSGYPTRVGGSPDPEEVGPIWARIPTMTQDEAGPYVIGEIFCRLNSGALLPVMRATCDEWAPDLVLRDPSEFASAVAAEERGIRHVRIAHGLAAEEASTLRIAAAPLQSFRPGVDLQIAESPYVTLFPEMLDESPFLDTRRYRLPAHSDSIRPTPNRSAATSNPLIYVTFGTVAPTMPGMMPLYHAVLEAVSGLTARVLLSVGREFDVAQLGTPPNNVRIERWVDHVAVMAEATLVVCHGGAGTTLGALSAGVPIVVFPLFADQGANAHAVVDAGAGVAVEALAGTAAHRTIHSHDTAALREAILRVLADPSYAEASAAIGSAFTSLPLLDDVYDEIVTGPQPA